MSPKWHRSSRCRAHGAGGHCPVVQKGQGGPLLAGRLESARQDDRKCRIEGTMSVFADSRISVNEQGLVIPLCLVGGSIRSVRAISGGSRCRPPEIFTPKINFAQPHPAYGVALPGSRTVHRQNLGSHMHLRTPPHAALLSSMENSAELGS